MKKLLFILLIAGFGWNSLSKLDSVSYGPGVLVVHAPVQEEITSASSLNYNDYEITPLTTFKIKARVLARENYMFGRESDLSPVDFALGWGNMSDESVLEKINISQSGRWYYWQVDTFPIPRREIETHSANMHLIPANDNIEESIDKVRKGDIIKLSGYLVKVSAKDGWNWSSSLSRDDTGNRACELIWVENFEIVQL